MAPAPRARPYKDFLTPLLHRRFAKATAYLAILCYAESLFIGGLYSWFWSWFPLGRAGIRAGLLFIPAFMIFVLRVGQMHVGLRTSFSAWQTFKMVPKAQIVQTIGFYLLSSYLFSEIYIWSSPEGADLGRIKFIPKTERPILNEKPIYLTHFLLVLSVVQAGCHLYFDYDRIDTQVTKTQAPAPSSTQDAHQSAHPADRLSASVPTLLFTAVKRVAVTFFLAPTVYYLPIFFSSYSLRSLAWSLTRSWAKIFYTLPRTSSTPSIGPLHIGVLSRTITSGLMLVMLWEIGNTAFSIYVALEPLKNGRPITYESRDPNGSLLTGLRGKKIQTRAFAFWELVSIAQRFEGRRKVIYEDIDRPGGSMWAQILEVSLGEIESIRRRISEFQRASPQIQPIVSEPQVVGLPRLTEPLKSGISAPEDLFNSPNRKTSSFETNVLTRNKASSNTLSPRAKQLIAKAEDAVLTPAQKQAKESAGVFGLLKDPIIAAIKLKIGKPFRQEYRRRLAAIALGEPFGDVGIIVDAINSLTRFAVCSLREDKYGNVQRDVKLIIRTFTSTVTTLEQFRNALGFHWTDVEPSKDSPEVDIVLEYLKGGLSELVEAFGDYSEDLRLSQSEMRLAREAAKSQAEEPQMQQTGR